MRLGIALAITLLGLSPADIAVAQSDNQFFECNSPDPTRAIAGCSAIVLSVEATRATSGVFAFNVRASAFEARGKRAGARGF